MRACFINPPIQDFYSTSIRRQPLGLLYVMASVKSRGYDVSFINGHSPKKHEVPVPDELRYLERYRQNDDPRYAFPFKRYQHFGLSFDEIKLRMRRSDPGIFFISSLFTPYYRECDRIIQIAKSIKPRAPIVIGGYHAALHPEYYLLSAGADFVICGEGEESSVQLLLALEGKRGLSSVSGLAYRENGAIVRNAARRIGDLDELPVPAREFLGERDFRAYRKKAVSMISSRGCPHRCAFCTARVIWGRDLRERSVGAVVAEIRECAERYGAGMINFEDDNLFPSRERAVRLLRGLIEFQDEARRGLDLTAMNGISIEQLDEDILELMVRAGFRELNISLMSRSDSLQKKQERPFDSDRFARIAGAARKLGMNVRGYFILGLPGQSAGEARDTVHFMNGLGVRAFPSVYYNVNAPREEWAAQRSSAFFNETDELSRDDLVLLFNECMREA